MRSALAPASSGPSPLRTRGSSGPAADKMRASGHGQPARDENAGGQHEGLPFAVASFDAIWSIAVLVGPPSISGASFGESPRRQQQRTGWPRETHGAEKRKGTEPDIRGIMPRSRSGSVKGRAQRVSPPAPDHRRMGDGKTAGTGRSTGPGRTRFGRGRGHAIGSGSEVTSTAGRRKAGPSS